MPAPADEVLPSRQLSPNYDIAWAGFDVFLLGGLASTAYFAAPVAGAVIPLPMHEESIGGHLRAGSSGFRERRQ